MKLFKSINVDTYYLEFDTARAGGFEPLKVSRCQFRPHIVGLQQLTAPLSCSSISHSTRTSSSAW